MSSNPKLILSPQRPKTAFGMSVCAIGDVDGDGFDDFLIGAPTDSLLNDNGAGTIYLYYGNASLDTLEEQALPRVRGI